MSSISVSAVGVSSTVLFTPLLFIVGGIVAVGFTMYYVADKVHLRMIYEEQKNSLRKKLKEMLSEIKNQCDDEIFASLKNEYKQIENLINNILEGFTLEKFSSKSFKNWLDGKINEVNQKIIEIKKSISELKDLREHRKQVIEKWKDIKHFEGFYEINKLQKDIKQLDHKSLSELKILIREIQNVSEYINMYQNIEEQFNKIHFPEGKGALHKKIKEIDNEIKALKMSSQSISHKKNIIEEYSKNIKILLEQSKILKDVKLSDDDFSVRKVILQEKKKKDEEVLEKLNLLEEEIDRYMSLVNEIDHDEYINLQKEISSLSGPNEKILRNLKERVKITYGKLKEDYYYTKVYKEQINIILSDSELENLTIRDMGNKLLEQKYIKSKEFWQFFQNYKETKRKEISEREKKKTLEKFLQTLESKGYSLVENKKISEIQEEEIVEIRTPSRDDYKIQVKLDKDGQIITRFVKEVESLNTSEYEKQRDIEIAKKWCETYKESIKQMNKEGCPIYIKEIQEPEDIGIIYVEKKGKSKVIKEQKYTRLQGQEKRL